MQQRAVIALGGNALIKDESRCSIDDQLAAVQEMAGHISDFIELGYEVVLTHGNGPQVGFILRRSELAFEAGELHFVPLKNCVANTQGAIGYQIQESLVNAFGRRKIDTTPVRQVTLVEVDRNDPSFARPVKPIGIYYQKEKAESLAQEFDIEFGGLDFSLAPFPDDAISLGGAMEGLGLTLGGSGGATAAAVIMSALDAARFKRAGFNGLVATRTCWSHGGGSITVRPCDASLPFG